MRKSDTENLTIWLITVGEPLPILSPGSRLWRTGTLAKMLGARGNEVIWWTSRFDHFRKMMFETGDSLEVSRNLRIRFLDGVAYSKNVSFKRLINHRQIAKHFRLLCPSERRPDIILCSYPTIELSDEAVRIAEVLGVPVILDVRDLWPDILVDRTPLGVRWLARLLLTNYFKMARRAVGGASALIAVSDGYLEWALRRAGRRKGPFDRVVPLGYSLPDDEIPTREEARRGLTSLGVNAEGIICVFSGTFGRTYDLGPVLDVAANFDATGEKFSFLICGDGERATEWRSKAAGRRNVTFTGWLDQTRMRAALVASDIGLAAYARGAPQGISNKVIEYLAAGLPVVSSLRGECANLLKATHSGVTYDADDTQSLAIALLELADNKRRLLLSTNARATFNERFRAESVYASLADELERLGRTTGSISPPGSARV